MVSHPEVNRRLREFVCLRLDHNQMQKHKQRLKVPTQGNQVLLTPKGEYVPDLNERGKRYKVEEFIEILDRVLKEYPGHPERKDDLRLSWFLWNPRDQGLPGHFGAEAVTRLDRKPVLTLSGPAPAWLDRPEFLRNHLREFIWTRGTRDGESRLTLRQYEPERKELLSLDLKDAKPEDIGRELDRAWLEYMKVRPMVARGYIDNPHGNWLKKVMEEVHLEEVRVREEAIKETLLPPGRTK